MDQNQNTFFKVGGTLSPNDPSYVERAADTELYERVRAGDYCYVLTTRQLGKSSLMVRTAKRLKEAGVLSAIVDLSAIGSDPRSVTADQWYFAVADTIVDRLGLELDLEAWWAGRSGLPPVQRVARLLRAEILARTSAPVVLFFDEIDSTLRLSFRDDFFAAVRACYNARAEDAEYNRLTFVLLGVASPSDLIADATRTPFNVGTRISLTDFTPDEARPLADGLGGDLATGKAALDRVLHWTDGHPYLTQKICRDAADRERSVGRADVAPEAIDRVVEADFLAPGADRRDDNLRFVRNRVEGRGVLTRRILKTYRQVLGGKPVSDEPTSPIHNELKLAGLVKSRADGRFLVRNRVYARVFSPKWVRQVWPADWTFRTAVTAIVLLILSPLLWYELLYPRPYEAQLRAALEDYTQARTAYQRLLRVPFYAGPADKLWSGFLERRALRAAVEDQRDEAILWRLQALMVLPERDDLRRAANQLIGPDYARLLKTTRVNLFPSEPRGNTGAPPSEFVLRAIALSPDGRHLAVGGRDLEVVRVWDLDRPAEEAVALPVPGMIVNTVAISLDGRRLAAGGTLGSSDTGLTSLGGGVVRIWDLDHPNDKPRDLSGLSTSVNAVAFSPDSRRLAASIASGPLGHPVTLVHVQDLDQPDPKPRDLPVPDGGANNVAFSRDGRQLAAGSANGVRVWDLDQPDPKPRELPWPEGKANAVAFSPDGHRLAAGGSLTAENAGGVRVWDLDQPDPKPCALRWQGGGVMTLGFSPDGRRLAAGGGFAGLSVCTRVWDLDQPDPEPLALRWQEGWVNAVAFSPDGRRLTVGGGRLSVALVRVWDLVHPDKPPSALPGPRARVNAVAVSPDGRRLAAGFIGGVRIWDQNSPNAEPRILPGIEDAVTAVAFSPNGRWLAVGLCNGNDPEGGVRLWDLDHPDDPPSALPWPGLIVDTIVFRPDGRQLAAGASGGFGGERYVSGGVRVWDLAHPVHRPLLIEQARSLKKGVVWDLAHPVHNPLGLPVNDGAVYAVAYSPDGRRLAAGLGVGASGVRLWDLSHPGDQPLFLRVPEAGVDAVAFSRDGRQLAAGLGAGVRNGVGIRVWNLDHPTAESRALKWRDGRVNALAFSADGGSIFVARNPWGYLVRCESDHLTPRACRLLPGFFPHRSASAFRLLEPSGEQLQVAVLSAGDSVVPTTLRFDAYDTAPLAGDPAQLLAEWQEKLALEIDQNGEITVANSRGGGSSSATGSRLAEPAR